MWKVYLRNENNVKLFMLKRNTSKFGARRNQTIIQRTSMFDSCWRNLVCAKPNMLHKHCSNENSMPHKPHHHFYLFTFVLNDWSSVINTAMPWPQKHLLLSASMYCGPVYSHTTMWLLRVLGFSVSYVNLLFAYEWSAVVWLKFHAHTTMMECTVFDARPTCKNSFFSLYFRAFHFNIPSLWHYISHVLTHAHGQSRVRRTQYVTYVVIKVGTKHRNSNLNTQCMQGERK